jgi:hypothetical protein
MRWDGTQDGLSLVFLILLPFYASLPAMLAHRLVHGLRFDTIGLMGFTALMALPGARLYLSLTHASSSARRPCASRCPRGERGAGQRLCCTSSTGDPL